MEANISNFDNVTRSYKNHSLDTYGRRPFLLNVYMQTFRKNGLLPSVSDDWSCMIESQMLIGRTVSCTCHNRPIYSDRLSRIVSESFSVTNIHKVTDTLEIS